MIMAKRYLFFVSHTYSYAICRPLQSAILNRGDEAAWYIEEGCPDLLTADEQRLASIDDVMNYNPLAVFSAGNWVYDFFPGVKVEVFHGYAMRKRVEKIDDHFTIRGWFDIYCTQGESSTPYFRELEQRHGYFKVYETGWCKADTYFNAEQDAPHSPPVVLYAPTFSKGITSVYALYDTIARLAAEKEWQWIITFHPKLDAPALIEQYKQLDAQFPNVSFERINEGVATMRRADVLLCDSSSITLEFMFLNKPVVTFRNTHPGSHLLDVREANEIDAAIEHALTRPPELMQNIANYTAHHEAHRDGHNSERVLEAVDDFVKNYKGKLKRKPLNLLRKLKIRMRNRYYHW